MRTTILVLVFALAVGPAWAVTQQPVSADAEAAAYREMAAAIPPGTRVKVQTKQGRTLTATLMRVTPGGIIVKRNGRLPEPAVEIPYTELAQLRREDRGGVSVVKAIGIGIASGAGAMLALIAFLYTID